MGDLLIRNMPDDLKRDLSDIARTSGRSMSDEAKAMLRKEIAARRAEKPTESPKNAYEELRSVFAPFDEESEEFSKIMDEVEAQRKKISGAPSVLTNDNSRYKRRLGSQQAAA